MDDLCCRCLKGSNPVWNEWDLGSVHCSCHQICINTWLRSIVPGCLYYRCKERIKPMRDTRRSLLQWRVVPWAHCTVSCTVEECEIEFSEHFMLCEHYQLGGYGIRSVEGKMGWFGNLLLTTHFLCTDHHVTSSARNWWSTRSTGAIDALPHQLCFSDTVWVTLADSRMIALYSVTSGWYVV